MYLKKLKQDGREKHNNWEVWKNPGGIHWCNEMFL